MIHHAMTRSQLEQLRQLLCHLQDSIRDGLIAARQKQAKNFSKVAAVTAADPIYQGDKISEHVIFDWFNAHWPRALPVEVVMAGIEDEELGTLRLGTPVSNTVSKC